VIYVHHELGKIQTFQSFDCRGEDLSISLDPAAHLVIHNIDISLNKAAISVSSSARGLTPIRVVDIVTLEGESSFFLMTSDPDS